MDMHWSKIGARHRQDAALRRQEICCLYFVGQDHDVLGELVLPGGMSTVSLPLAAIARGLVRLDAAYLFLAHNHPSGEARPSEQDIATTRQIWRTARAVGASLQDHYIFGRTGCFSFRENGLL